MNSHVNSQSPTKAVDGHALPVGTWRLDPDQTTITVTAKKLGVFTVPATLTTSGGTIEIGSDHQVTRVEVVADAGSYTSRNAKRNDHIRGADFLDADNHPDLVFTAEQLKPTADGYQAAGSVTVKAETFPLDVDISNVEYDAHRGSFVATATIDRNAIGVTKLPSLVIGRNIELTVAATAVAATAVADA